MNGWLKVALIGAACYWGAVQLKEHVERQQLWGTARSYCDEVGKPLLRIGLRRSPLEPPNGDVTLDIDTAVTRIPGGVLGDVRNMPFPDKYFGAVVSEHVIEHLFTAEDVEQSISECVRVADMAIIEAPSPWSFGGLFHPDHKLRIWFEDNVVKVDKKWYIPGWVNAPPVSGRVGQYMVLREDLPKVISL